MKNQSPVPVTQGKKLTLHFFETNLSKGVSSTKTSIYWDQRGGEPVHRTRVHKVDNSGG